MTTINGFQIDAAVSEEHNDECEVTEHPVEAGADITDHMRRRPRVISLDCVVSDTPFGKMATARGFDDVAGFVLPSDDARALMDSIFEKREPVTIITAIRTYENMAPVMMTEPRNSSSGDAMRFRCTFKQILLVTNERTTVKVAAPSGKKKRKLGSAPTTPTTYRMGIKGSVLSETFRGTRFGTTDGL